MGPWASGPTVPAVPLKETVWTCETNTLLAWGCPLSAANAKLAGSATAAAANVSLLDASSIPPCDDPAKEACVPALQKTGCLARCKLITSRFDVCRPTVVGTFETSSYRKGRNRCAIDECERQPSDRGGQGSA